jgi:KamA family protein
MPRINATTDAFRRRFFPNATLAEWNDWRWQSRHRITKLAQLEAMVQLSADERDALVQGESMLPVGITPYYLSLVSPDDPMEPLRRTVLPVTGEFVRAPGEADDPLGEDGHMAVPGLVHRYPDRVLFLVLDFCSTYCRYCTRSRVVGHGEISPDEKRLEMALDYIRRTPTIRDVLLSGGDPLAMADHRLDWVLTRLREIPHVEFVRIGTKMPAVLPQRITPELVKMLRKHHPLWMSIHFMHPSECTPESYRACARLADAGIPLGSQTVLCKDVNDDVETMKHLPVRPDLGLVPLPHLGREGARDHRRPARPHHRLRGADLRRRRARRRREDPAATRLPRRPRRRRPRVAQLRGQAVPLPGPGTGRGGGVAGDPGRPRRELSTPARQGQRQRPQRQRWQRQSAQRQRRPRRRQRSRQRQWHRRARQACSQRRERPCQRQRPWPRWQVAGPPAQSGASIPDASTGRRRRPSRRRPFSPSTHPPFLKAGRP